MGCIALDGVQTKETILLALKEVQNKCKETPLNFFRNSIRKHLNESTRRNYFGSSLACLMFCSIVGVVTAKLLQIKAYQEPIWFLICSNLSSLFTCLPQKCVDAFLTK